MTKRSKRCPACGETKQRTEFSPRNGYCRPCATKRATDRYRDDPAWREKRKTYHREHQRRTRADPERNAEILERLRQKRIDDPGWAERQTASVNERRRALVGWGLAFRAGLRAKKRGMECTITPEWTQALWERSPTCAYCERPLRSAIKKLADDSATLDRVDSTRGYTVNNTVFACFRCNSIKRDATADELATLAENIRRVVSGVSVDNTST